MDDLATQSNGAFVMRYSGYEFVSESSNPEMFTWGAQTDQSAESSMVRLTGETAIRAERPYLSPSIRQLLRMPRAGYADVQALGGWMLREARRAGAELVRGEVVALDSDAVGDFVITTAEGQCVGCEQLVLAGGPFSGRLAAMLGLDLPIENVLQQKILIGDPLGVIPRDMPFTIFADPQRLDWSEEDAEMFAADPEFAFLLDEFPAGLHIKPESGRQIKLGWAYNRAPQVPEWSPVADDRFPEIVVRGARRFIPALDAYVDELPAPVHQFAGYYSRTPENLPLIGPLGMDGVFTVSALSGYGTMAACAAGELCAASMTGGALADYADYFSPARYQNHEIMAEVERVGSDGQL